MKKSTLRDATQLELEFSERIGLPSAEYFTVVNQGKRIPVTGTTSSQENSKIILALASEVVGGFVVEVSSALSDASGNAIPEGSLFVTPAPSPFDDVILIDFGSAGASTGDDEDPLRSWNNVSSVGISNTGTIGDLLSVSGTKTGIGLEMVRRFNGASSSGSTVAGNYPSSASGDSLFGNTAEFSGISDVFPAFRITGLDPEQTYQLTFYASRTGVSDKRETLYTVTGSGLSETTLDPARNVDREASLEGLIPDSNGNLLIEISPSSKNTNSNQFTYLGVLQISSPDATLPVLHPPVSLGTNIIIDWSGAGMLETSTALVGTWTPIVPAPTPPLLEEIGASGAKFFRLRHQVE